MSILQPRSSISSLIATENILYSLKLNHEININNIAYEYDKISNNNNDNITITRCSDIMDIEYFEFIKNPDVSFETFIIELKKSTIYLSFGQNKVEFPLNLLINLNFPECYDNKVYLKTCFDIFFGNIPLVALEESMTLKISNFYELGYLMDSYGIICKLTYYYKPEIRQALVKDKLQRLYQELSWYEYNLTNIREDDNKYEFNLNFSRISKGFFIECENINNLNELKLLFYFPNDPLTRIAYNKFLLKSKSIKINENMIYLPFNYDKSYTDISNESYEGGIDLSRIDDLILVLTFSQPINNIKIYNVGMNLLCKNIDQKKWNVLYSSSYVNGELSYEHQCYSGVYYFFGGKHKNKNKEFNPPIIKKINDVSTCPILIEVINIDDTYLSCDKCKNNFSEKAIKQWIINKNTCPTCRDKWTNYQIYKNSDEP